MPSPRLIPSLAFVLVFASILRAQQAPLRSDPEALPSATAQTLFPATDDPRALYQALQALRLDPQQVYPVQDLYFRRGPVRFSFSEGRLAFYAPLQGHITGAVFSGTGRVTMLPREPSEKLSLLHFTGLPLLDQSFSRAYLRFTDDTAADLQRQLAHQGSRVSSMAVFTDSWDSALENIDSWHSLRILSDLLAARPRPYFFAELFGGGAGPLDVLIDPQREEPVIVGQIRVTNGVGFYDVWASLPGSGPDEGAAGDFRPISYVIATTIHDDRSLDGATTLKVRCVRGGERALNLQLARELPVEKVEQIIPSANGYASQPIAFFQDTEFNSHGAVRSGVGDFLVLLNQPSVAGQEYELRVTYRGTVISDAGNGVLFVAERGSWYASLPGPDRFVPFDITFRWPRQLTLVATGKQVDDRTEGEMRVGHWITPEPASVAGFNLGEYVRQTVRGSVDHTGLQVDVYANRQLEAAIADRLRIQASAMNEFSGDTSAPSQVDRDVGEIVPQVARPLPSPAAILSKLGKSMLDSIGFMEKWNGAFPFERLAISQIPGSFGQGWPGLIYLPTLAFLPREAQQQAGLATVVQEQLSQLVPFHELAHQWWGNTVGVESYRDTWILESMANYLSLMYSDARHPAAHILDNWLEAFSQQLNTTVPGSKETMESMGPLSLGYRLNSSQAPNAYNTVLYGKGTWVIHMLRMMLREPGADSRTGTSDADGRFIAVLHDLLERHRFQAISTADFQRAVESHMTSSMDLEGGRKMDWFFDEWVSQTGLPEYRVEFQAHIVGGRVQIRGTLFQDGVSDTFTLPVPLYAASPRSSGTAAGEGNSNSEDSRNQIGANERRSISGKLVFLGTVVTTGPETKFQFWLPGVSGVAASSMRSALRLHIDPSHTLLCLTK